MEAAATPADLAVCSYTKSPEQQLYHSLLPWSSKYFKPVLDKTTSGNESTMQVSSREQGSLSSEQVYSFTQECKAATAVSETAIPKYI